MEKYKVQLVSTGKKRLIPTDRATTDTKYDNDHLFEQLSDLVNESFRAWYCKRFFVLGKERVLVLAAQARADGNNKQRLFSYLLKQG